MSDAEVMAALGEPDLLPEGRFFPDTYAYSRGVSDLTVLKRARAAMQRRLTAAWAARAPDLPDTVIREAAVMRRQVDHHLARARAVGRRAVGQACASVADSVEAVLRAVTRLYERTRFDLDGNRDAQVAIERQDLDAHGRSPRAARATDSATSSSVMIVSATPTRRPVAAIAGARSRSRSSMSQLPRNPS